MTMMQFLMKPFSCFRLRLDDDSVDRLSRHYTVIILIICGLFVGIKQFLGQPITCWTPAQFTDGHRAYADAICWGSNTYLLPSEDIVPAENISQNTNEEKLSYYHWVPGILILQGLVLFLPRLLWLCFNRSSGVEMATIVNSARICSEGSDMKTREDSIQMIIHQMHRYLLPQQQIHAGQWTTVKQLFDKVCCLSGGNYLMSRYLITKSLYFVGIVVQLVFLRLFFYKERLSRFDWTYSERLPRITLCEFEIRHQSRVHNYILQCTVTINHFSEKLFLFVWFWLVFLAFITAVNFLSWLFRSVYWPGHAQYVRKQIRAMDTNPGEAGIVAKFVDTYLRSDGMFIIQLIGLNTSDAVAGEVLCGLWSRYRRGQHTWNDGNELEYRAMSEKLVAEKAV